ncbi:MAG TPA: polysaccharide deacetylase family protein [Candidatus Limiplasma sp.]|nr:polysaccharide deacetylase family protein [Candidatus Limiplasma sp.]
MKRRLLALFLLAALFFLPAESLAKAGFKSYFSGDASSPQIAITMDDLYSMDCLEQALDLCQTYDIHMTFFALGDVIKAEDAALWQRVVDEGNEIGNHTFGHPNITKITSYQLQRQLIRTQDALNAVLREPYTMRLFRPPFGEYDRTGYGSTEVLGSLGYHYIIMWTVCETDPDKAFKQTQNGSILLFHTNEKDIECLETLIPRLLEAGFEPVTVSELLDLPAAEDENSGA